MAKTLDQLRENALRYCYVLAVGGHPKLITNHPIPSQLFLSGQGWDGTDWDVRTIGTNAISGLRVEGAHRSVIEPWSAKITVERLSFFIQNCDDLVADSLAVFHAPRAGNETQLDADLDASETTVTVRSSSAFAASGRIYIGAECIDYAANTGTSFTGCDRGIFEPFPASGLTNQFGRAHKLPELGVDVDVPLLVTDAPRHWAGRTCALYVHRIAGGLIDPVSEALCVWSGYLCDAPKDTVDGETVLVAEDCRARVRDCTLARNQFHGYLNEGFWLVLGTTFDLETAADATVKTANQLVAVSAASGANEVEAGWTSTAAVKSAINTWLAAEIAAARLVGNITAQIVNAGDAWRFRFVWDVPSGSTLYRLRVRTTGMVWQVFGWESVGGSMTYEWHEAVSTGDVELTSDDEPLRLHAASVLSVDSEGTWFNNALWLPQVLKDQWAGILGANYGIISVGGQLAVAKHLSDSALGSVYFIPDLLGSGTPSAVSVRWGQEGEVEVTQIPILAGSLAYLLPRILASTGTTGYGHATYDVLPAQFGAALPWGMLGDDFLSSLNGLAMADAEIVMVFTKPTTLMAKLGVELVLRNAHMVLSQGKIVLRALQTPTAAGALHALDETSKGICDRSGRMDPDRTSAETTREHSRNLIKLRFNFDPLAETWNDNGGDELEDATSIEIIGTRPVTLECCNTFAGLSATGDAVKELVANLAASVLPAWSLPLQIVRRSLGISLWADLVAGDICTLDDKFIRDPVTGAREVVGLPCCILETSHDWGDGDRDPWGHIVLLLPRWARAAVYSPSAEVDDSYWSLYTFDHGYYDTGTEWYFAVKNHAHSDDSESADGTYFVAGDKVRVVQIDPDDPAAPETYVTTVVSTGTIDATRMYIEVAADFAAFDVAHRYRIISDDYATAVTAQRTDCYQSDDADLRVQDLRGPYEYGDTQPLLGAAGDPTELPERHADVLAGDGKPLSSSVHQALIRFANNYPSFKSARCQGAGFFGGTNSYILGPASTIWEWKWTKPYSIGGPGLCVSGGLSRKMILAPMMCSNRRGDTVYARVTLSLLPPSGSSQDGVSFSGPYNQLTFETFSDSPAVLDSQQVAPVVHPSTGWGYMTLELCSAASSGQVAMFYGMAEDRLGPLE